MYISHSKQRAPYASPRANMRITYVHTPLGTKYTIRHPTGQTCRILYVYIPLETKCTIRIPPGKHAISCTSKYVHTPTRNKMHRKTSHRANMPYHVCTCPTRNKMQNAPEDIPPGKHVASCMYISHSEQNAKCTIRHPTGKICRIMYAHIPLGTKCTIDIPPRGKHAVSCM